MTERDLLFSARKAPAPNDRPNRSIFFLSLFRLSLLTSHCLLLIAQQQEQQQRSLPLSLPIFNRDVVPLSTCTFYLILSSPLMSQHSTTSDQKIL